MRRLEYSLRRPSGATGQRPYADQCERICCYQLQLSRPIVCGQLVPRVWGRFQTRAARVCDNRFHLSRPLVEKVNDDARHTCVAQLLKSTQLLRSALVWKRPQTSGAHCTAQAAIKILLFIIALSACD